MRTIPIKLIAGQQKKISATGVFLALLSASGPIDLEVEMIGKAGNPDVMKGIPEGYSEVFPEMFNSITITSSTDQTVKVGYSMGQARIDRSTIVSQQSTATDNIAPVPVLDSATPILGGLSTRRRIVALNPDTNTGKIGLGGPSLTAANCARWLSPGDAYVETDAAPAPLYAIAEVSGESLCVEVA